MTTKIGPNHIVVSTVECGSKGHGFKSHKMCDFSSLTQLLSRVSTVVVPVRAGTIQQNFLMNAAAAASPGEVNTGICYDRKCGLQPCPVV